MIFPIILAVIAAVFYALTNHIDKFLISKAVKNADYKALILVSTIIAGGVMALIYLFICGFDLAFDLPSIALLLINSALYTVANVVWFKALDRDDTTLVVIMFQLIPVFMLLLSPILLSDQGITLIQLVGGLIITAAAILVTYEPAERKFDKSKLVTLAMMAVVSVLYAVWFIIERFINVDHDFNKTIFWSNVTLLLVGIVLFVLMATYRQSFQKMLRTNGPKVIGLNLVNELLNSFGGVLSTLGGTMVPISIISFATQGVQPIAVMVLGLLIAKFLPKIEREDTTKKEVIKRTLAIIICVIGLACIEFGQLTI